MTKRSISLFLMTGMCALSFSVAAEVVNLSGTVSDEAGAPVKRAVVKLQSVESIRDTTDSAGQFSLSGVVSPVSEHREMPHSSPFAALRGSLVEVNLVHASAIGVAVYSTSGRMVYSSNSGKRQPGINRASLPMDKLGSGVYVVLVHHEGNRSVFRYIATGQNGVEGTTHRSKVGSSPVLKKNASGGTSVSDTLVVTADGYAAKKFPLSSHTQEGIKITLKAVTVPIENFTETVKGGTLEMVLVQGGTYKRGCDDCAAQDKQYETPIHNVTLSNFFIGKFEVTQALWQAVMGDSGVTPGGSDKSPQIGVSWFDANKFACKLSSMTGKSYRLPTDAEWEFSARGGNVGKDHQYRYSGSNRADSVAWYSGNSGNRAHDVGTKAANELGIHDMSGNAWEWVYDWLVGYTEGARTDPVQLTGSGNKTRRGGSSDEPEDFARVTRRAIRSRDGAAGMGFRIALSVNLPPGMVEPCEAANPTTSSCTGEMHRDCRLITKEGEVWTGSDNAVIIRANGVAAVSGFPNTSGEWYTLNNRSLNIVATSGAKATTTYAYFVFSEDEMTMISSEGMPFRLFKRPVAEVTGTVPTVPVIATPTELSKLIASVDPARIVTDAQLANPDTSKRDPKLIPDAGYTWFFDGNCCGGNHKYRFHLEADGNAEFVVMDYNTSLKENVLARGRWFTVGNVALHFIFNGKYYNYLYTTGNRSTSYSEYMPAGPIFSHISLQSYERGDFRIFNRTLYDDKVKRPKDFAGENPVYDPGEYLTGSGE